jgi:hypothetical protein
VFVPSSMLPYTASLVTFSTAVQMVREGGRFDVYDITAYGAEGTSGSLVDSTLNIQAALNAANAVSGGDWGVVLCPGGSYKTTAPLLIYKRTTLQGSGWQNTTIGCDHIGDGVQSTWTPNGSTAAFITIKDISISSPNAGNVGSGIADLGGTYIRLENVYVEGFRDQISLDQSELVVIEKCYTNQSSSRCRSGIWIVNGPDRVVGNNRMYTNGITIKDHQFNGTGYPSGVNLRDDGGRNHVLINCNFNGGGIAAEFAGVTGLTIMNGASEGHATRGLSFVSVQALSGIDVGPCRGVSIRNFSGNDAVIYSIILNAGQQGSIEDCWFSQATLGCIRVTAADVFGWSIAGNHKRVEAGVEVQGPVFVAGLPQWVANQLITQRGMSRVAASQASGAQVVTPATAFGESAAEAPANGSHMWCVNADGTNGEDVTITAIGGGGTTWTATFATAKAADWQAFKTS